MKYKIFFIDAKQISRDISKIGMTERHKIFTKIDSLSQQGIQHAQVKGLNNYTIADFRMRVGNYRILFNCYIDKKEIHIIRILHRSKLY